MNVARDRHAPGFTLIELLVIIAIMAMMVSVSVANVRAGQGVARVRGATRDIFAVIRHARSVALVSQQPSIITYSTKTTDGEVSAVVDVNSAKLLSSGGAQRAMTLQGEIVVVGGDEESVQEQETQKSLGYTINGKDPTSTAESNDSSFGQTVEDVLFEQISSDVVAGMRIKVLMEDEELGETVTETKSKPKISVFSNVDYLIGRFKDAKEKESSTASKEGDASKDTTSATTAPAAEEQEPISVVWEVNGRTEPHSVWVYPDGAKPEDGLCIKIDRFGAAKVVTPGEEDER